MFITLTGHDTRPIMVSYNVLGWQPPLA